MVAANSTVIDNNIYGSVSQIIIHAVVDRVPQAQSATAFHYATQSASEADNRHKDTHLLDLESLLLVVLLRGRRGGRVNFHVSHRGE